MNAPRFDDSRNIPSLGKVVLCPAAKWSKKRINLCMMIGGKPYHGGDFKRNPCPRLVVLQD